jgi:peptidoglycan/LPS O-acetylase OafA/YrhL
LAVEEQFYIVWAFAVLPVQQLTPKLRTSFLLLVMMFSIIYRWRMFHIKDMDLMSKSLSANAYALISGSLLTFNWTSLSPKIMRRWVGNAGIILFLATVALLRHDGLVYSGAIWGPFTTVVAAIITIIGCVEHGNYFLELQILRYLGRISYSLYLWHHVLLWFGGLFNQVTIASVSVMSFSFIIAHCSTVYFEEPLRERFKQTTWFKAQKANLAEHTNLLPSHTK